MVESELRDWKTADYMRLIVKEDKDGLSVKVQGSLFLIDNGERVVATDIAGLAYGFSDKDHRAVPTYLQSLREIFEGDYKDTLRKRGYRKSFRGVWTPSKRTLSEEGVVGTLKVWEEFQVYKQ